MRDSQQSSRNGIRTRASGIICLAWGLIAAALNLALIQACSAGLFTNVGALNLPRSGQTATLLQNGKILIAGFYASAELYDPATGQWSITGSMIQSRYNHTATLLSNGKVLVAGGTTNTFTTFSSVEIYDPATQTWSTTGPLNFARQNHTATSLPDGNVLVAAGDNGTNHLSSAEVYDPVAETWANTGSLAAARAYHTATSLKNGKVLVAGGGYPLFTAISTAEMYDEATGTWTNTDSMTTARSFHTATLLPDGIVLVAGGATYQVPPIADAELYDPATGSWTNTGSLNFARDSHTATLLPDGKVLVAGGEATNDLEQSSSELYDPASGSWAVDSSLSTARAAATATLLPNGSVLMAGGYNAFIGNVAQAEVYDAGINPTTGTWTETNSMNVARYWHTATLLPDGKVLAVAGYFSGPTAEVYDPDSGTWTMTSNMVSGHAQFAATLLPNGEVLAAGGLDDANEDTAIAELYYPASSNWVQTGSMISPRAAQTATLLRNGKVLVAGGLNLNLIPTTFTALISSEIYDPASGTWTASGTMNTNRSWHSATMLNDGRVLVAGGETMFASPSPVATAEIYDLATGIWTPTGSMTTARYAHSASLLPNGMVLVAGGSPDGSTSLASAELFNPLTGTWTATSNSMAFARLGHTATLMPDGKVLVAGGYDGMGETLSSAEMYDPATGTWTEIANEMNATRYLHTATLLTDGTLLIIGGDSSSTNGDNPLIGVEVYQAGLGFSNVWQPQIGAATSPLSLGGGMVVRGSGFSGISGASSGGAQDSASDYPLLQLRSLEGGKSVFLLATNWGVSLLTSVSVTNFPPGYALATVFVNGIPSTSSVVNVSVPVPIPAVLTNAQRLANGSFQFGFTNTPGALFGVLATTNAALPLTNWTAMGGVAEVAPGQFEFTDSRTTNNPRQFYQVRAP